MVSTLKCLKILLLGKKTRKINILYTQFWLIYFQVSIPFTLWPATPTNLIPVTYIRPFPPSLQIPKADSGDTLPFLPLFSSLHILHLTGTFKVLDFHPDPSFLPAAAH